MINITFEQKPEERTFRLDVHGHAGQAQTGQDIVCASVSILTYTVANAVKNSEFEGKVDDVAISLKKGNATICATAKDEDTYVELIRILSAITDGYGLLEGTFPQYVAFKRR